MRRQERVVVVAVLALLCLPADRDTARSVPRPARQQEVPQRGWQGLALTQGVGHEVAEVERCGILEDSLLEERNGTVGVKHRQGILLGPSKV